MSHTNLDTKFCDDFDRVVARVGVKVFRSEFENITSPSWKTIREEMRKSCALFLLVGEKLVESQAKSELSVEEKQKWKYTQNWISYEVGLACQLNIDVWIICDNVIINFPVPFLNNYEIWGINPPGVPKGNFEFYRNVFQDYVNGKRYQLSQANISVCPYKECKAEYNLHSSIQPKGAIICPTCLNKIIFEDGF
jgi:DNA-directed RNA polymerase subunit RPC12/RpoP